MEKLSDYRAKNVPGLYTYYHFEKADGSFVQISYRGDYVVHQSKDGTRTEYTSIEALKRAWMTTEQ